MGQNATIIANDRSKLRNAQPSNHRKIVSLPNGGRYSGYQEFGVHRTPWTGVEDDNKLIVVRREHPHPTSAGRGLVPLESLENSQLCSVCKGIEAIGVNCHFELVHLTLSRLKDRPNNCPLCALISSALKQPYSLNSPLVSGGGNNPLASTSWSQTWGNLTINIPGGFDFMRRDFADISIASWPHPQRSNLETYYHVYLGHDGQDHGMATFSISVQSNKLHSISKSNSHQEIQLIRKHKFDRMCAWLAEDVKRMGNTEMEFIQGERLPSRLLDVGTMEGMKICCSSGNHEQGSLRIIHTKDAQFGQLPVPNNSKWKHYSSLNPRWIYYAVLSHRWGKSTELSSTNKANLQTRFKKVQFSKLCRTFQDAIIVARELRIRYLWIDSLCIVQDDKEDWKKESAIMGDVYYKGFVTLFAHSYPQESTFRTVDDSKKKPATNAVSLNTSIEDPQIDVKAQAAKSVLPVELDGGSGFLDTAFGSEGDSPVLLGSVDTKPESQSFVYVRRQRMFEVDIQNSGLTSRGWIVQERLLSPRIIHFFDNQIYYESKLNGIVRAEDRTPAYSDPDKLREYIFSSQTRFGATPDEWFKVVERFCSCQLTQGSDKLLAIGGIAQKFHEESQVTYWAGLFADRVAKGFLWIKRGPSLTRVHCRAPSWSWASVDGPIRYSSLLLDRPFRVLQEVSIHNSFTNSLDEPKHLAGLDNVRFLYAHGYMRKIRLSRDCTDVTLRKLFEHVSLPSVLPYELDTDGIYRKLLDANGINIGWVFLDIDDGDETPEEDYCTLIVATEEAWVLNKQPLDPLDIIYRTHPPTPEFLEFEATGVPAIEYERLNADEHEVQTDFAPGERFLLKTYWVLIMVPEPLPPDVYTPADPNDKMVGWKRVGMGQIFEKMWLRKKDYGGYLLG